MSGISNQYGSWFKDVPTPYPDDWFRIIELRDSEINMLRYISEIGGKYSLYDMAHGIKIERQEKRGKPIQGRDEEPRRDENSKLGYSYSQINKNASSLFEKELISIVEDSSGGRLKKIPKLTIIGYIYYLQAWKRLDMPAKISIAKTIHNNPELLPLSKYWDEIVKLIGEESAYNSLRRIYNVKGVMFFFNVQEPSIKFESFIPHVVKGPNVVIPGDDSSLREFHEGNIILNYIKNNHELSNILISNLIVKDLFYWYNGFKDDVPQENWNTERISAFLEDRRVEDNPIFKNRRFGEYFPYYAGLKYSFTGLLLDHFIWDVSKSVPKKTIGSLKDGIRITLDR